MADILRMVFQKVLSVAVGVGTTGAFEAAGAAAGVIVGQSGWTGLTSFTFLVADSPTGSFYALRDKAGAAVSVTVTPGDASELPSQVLMAGAFKAVANVVVPAGSAKTVTVILKS